MYYYIFDPQKLSQKEFERVQNQLYSCLSEFKINGEISRVTSLRTIAQLVDIAFSREVKTLVAVGTDDTFQEMINAVGDREVTLAYIPIMETELSKIFGLTDIPTSAKTIASRRIEHVDLGLVNNNWFITRLDFGQADLTEKRGLFGMFGKASADQALDIKFSVDGKYSAGLKVSAGVILNSRDNSCGDNKLANPTDSLLDVLLLPDLKGYSTFRYRKDIENGCFENIPGCSTVHCKKLEITSPEGITLKSNGRVIAKTPALVEILPKALKMIVGKDRTF